MRCWIVRNGSLTSKKHSEPSDRLLSAAKRLGSDAEVRTNDSIRYVLTSNGIITEDLPDAVIFWDKDIRLAQCLETCGVRVFNSSDAIEACDDKSLTALILSKNNIPIPRTVTMPKTYYGYEDLSFIDGIVDTIGLPLVVKECYGSFGEQVYLAKDRNALIDIVKACGNKPLILQEFIANSAGRDVRINVVGDEVVAAMYRCSTDGDFRANVTRGGSMERYDPDDLEMELALRTVKALGLDFGGVDILFGEDGPMVCEVNSNAHMENIFQCTGIDVAESIIGYVMNTLSGR